MLQASREDEPGATVGGGEKILYPMLGVGAFFVMFWVGFVVGHELGLGCGLLLLNALFFAGSGTWFVVRLESEDAGARVAPPPATGRERRSGETAQPARPPRFASGIR